jgi:hypothetical protein
MKRIEVKLALPVVAPLLDVIKALADPLKRDLAAPPVVPDLEAEFREEWQRELLDGQAAEVQALLALFDEGFFREGVVAFDEDNAEVIIRACAAVRLALRERYLKAVDDDTLESGEVNVAKLAEPLRRAFMCYLFLATIQELIIKHLDESIIDS